MSRLLKRLKEEAHELHFNSQGIKAISFLAKDAVLFLKAQYLKVLCFDFLAAILNAAAYVLTLHVLQQIEGKESSKLTFLDNTPINTEHYIVLLVIVIFFISSSVELRYRSFTVVCSIWEAFSIRCTTLGVQAINRKFNFETSLDTPVDMPKPDATNRQLLKRMVNKDALSTGIFAKKLAQILSHILQTLVFLSVLLYLNITITLIVLLLSSILFVFYLNSFLNVAKASNTRQELAELSRDEISNLYKEIESNKLTNSEMSQKIKTLLLKGNVGKFLHQKIYVRKSIKRGASIIEYTNPLTLLIIAIILYNTDYFHVSISTIIIYFLLVKKMIAIAVKIGDDFITINRMHPNITNYLRLIDKIKPNE